MRTKESVVYSYDHTWNGMLTCVFDSFFRHEQPLALLKCGTPSPLFTENHEVISDSEKAGRVSRKLESVLSAGVIAALIQTLYCDEQNSDLHLFRFLCKAVTSVSCSIERNMADEDVRFVVNTFRKIRRERLRMMQFLRFQKAADGTYFAMIAPYMDVLPLIVPHFADRFSEECWLIYDNKRQYGVYYNAHQALRITLDGNSPVHKFIDGKLTDNFCSNDEKLFQELWKTYFKAICIHERNNPKKQVLDIPRRYWRYLTEKQ